MPVWAPKGRRRPRPSVCSVRTGALRQYRLRELVFGMVVRWGCGLGGAFILNNELYAARTASGGEIGHIQTASIKEAEDLREKRDSVYKQCPRCGAYCLETLIKALAASVGEAVPFIVHGVTFRVTVLLAV
jgi:hypothetical protein